MTCSADISISKPSQIKLVERRGYVFCTRMCAGLARKKGGAIRAKTETTNLEKYGCTNPVNSTVVRDKIRQAMLEKHGVEHYFQSDEFKTKAKTTWKQTLGVDNPLKLKSNHDAGICAARQPNVRIRAQETYKSHYNVNPIQHALQVTHGVDNASQLPNAHTWLNTPNACRKRHHTMKQNGSYKKSSIEDQMYETLCAIHGIDDIERQVSIPGTRWAIDFYVKSTDTYVQLDGEYWHGLDRSLDEIAQHKSKRDIIIHQKWMADRKQDEWFEAQGLKLIRITDKQFMKEGLSLSYETFLPAT